MASKIWPTAVLLLAAAIGFEGLRYFFSLADFDLYFQHSFPKSSNIFLFICLHTGAPAVPEGKLLENQVSSSLLM